MEAGIQILKDFVEGKLSDIDFEKALYKNPEVETLLSDPALNWNGTYLQNTTAFLYLIALDYKTFAGRLQAHGAVDLFLKKKGIETVPSTHHSNIFNLLAGASPKYIDLDPDFIERYILPADRTITKTELERRVKQRYTDLFRYQTKPPRWIQSPEWLIKNNKPLFFLGQFDIKNCSLFHDDGSVYLFVNTETGTIETVTQFY